MNGKEQEKKELSEYPCPEQDDLETVGVLLSDEIEHKANKYRMIYPFNHDKLKPAGYELTLGKDYAIGGRLGKLYNKPGRDELRIPPFEVAIISTNETINLPRFIIARWNLPVRLAYEGLLWTGALQVDPGWVGPLFCPLYNLSNEEVMLKLGEPIALMDFVKTTSFKKGYSKEYPRPPKNRRIKDYNWKLKSALFTEGVQRIDDVEKKVNRVESIIGLVFTCIAIQFAALSIFVTSAEKVSISLPVWLYISVALSIVAITISIYSLVKKSRGFDIVRILTLSAIVILVLLIWGTIQW